MSGTAVKTANQVFVSYARADGAFVRALCAALEARGVNAWVDWQDIPPSDEWFAAIRRGIDAADAFAFVMSPHSIASGVCGDELAHAINAGKRLIPLVRDDADRDKAPADLKKLQWIFARRDDEFPEAVDRFIEALTTDLVHLRMHARTLVRAREWVEREHDASFLLRGRDLREAERWLASLDSRGPLPSSLHSEFILASQQAERDENERWKRLYEQSLARQLAAQSQLLVDQRGTALPLATILAVEAARRSPSLETDQALRKALALTPLKYRKYPSRKFDVSFWAENADRVALIDDQKIEVRALDPDRLLARIEAPGPIRQRGIHRSPVVLSRDGSRLAAIVGERLVCAWNVNNDQKRPAKNREPLAKFDFDDRPLLIALTRDATRLAVMTEPRTLLFDIDAGRRIATIEHGRPMVGMSLHPDARELAVWGGSSCDIWDLSNPTSDPTLVASIPHNGSARFAMLYSPLGEYLALLQPITFQVRVFHVRSRKLIFSDERHVDLAFEPQDRRFAIASPEWDIGVYSLPKCERIFRMKHDDSVWQVAFSPNGQRLSSVSKDGTVRVWELEREGREVARIVETGAGVLSTVFAEDSERLSLLKQDYAQLCDARGYRQWRLIDLPSAIFAVHAAPEARHIAFGCRDGSWAIIDYDQADAIRVIAQSAGRRAMGEQVTDIALVGTKVLLKRSFGSYDLIDLGSGQLDEPFSGLHASVAVSFHAGTIVTASDQNQEILIWNGEIVRRRTPDSPVRALACASGGSAIAALLQDGSVTIYTSDLAAEIARFIEPFGLGVEIDAGGKQLARWEAGDRQSQVQVIEIASRKTIAEWTVPSRITDLRFDPRGDRVVLALHDKSVQVWGVQQSVVLAAFKHEASATCACFTADADVIASGGWDGAVRMWHWKSEALVHAACGRLERNLTRDEWNQYLPGEPYRKTCDDLLPARRRTH